MKMLYYVVVTRGHLGDSACARAILRETLCIFRNDRKQDKGADHQGKAPKRGLYGGTVGSDPCPHRTSIGGQMPAEIAVSIMAEIVQEKNWHFRTYCDEEVEAAVCRRTPGTMVTIIEKKRLLTKRKPGARCSYSGQAMAEASAAEKWS